jgi:hypothetical protein
MSLVVRRVVLTGATAFALLGIVAPSYAETEDQCEQHMFDSGGTCIDEGNGNWSLSSDGDSDGSGAAGAFGVLFVLVILIGIGATIWKVTTARKLAREAGMDPDLATGMTLLTDDGLSATYLASSLRRPEPSGQPTPSNPRTPAPAAPAAARLAELKGLLDAGAITQVEYDDRRKAIIDSV